MPIIYFYIATEEISKVIGVKGKHIKQLERDHKVTSRIFNRRQGEKDPFPGFILDDKTNTLWTAMMVSGLTKHVFEACKSVAARVDELGDVIVEYSMDKERRHLFFQNGGLPIKQISATSDCRINVPVQDGPVQLECSNLEDARTALSLVLAHAGLLEGKEEATGNGKGGTNKSRVPGRSKGRNSRRKQQTAKKNQGNKKNLSNNGNAGCAFHIILPDCMK